MAKKSKVTSILNGSVNFAPAAVFFTLGGYPCKADGTRCEVENGDPAFPVVSDIKYSRARYGSGVVYDNPAYIVEFEDASESVLIPEKDVVQITFASLEDTENVPNLPQN